MRILHSGFGCFFFGLFKIMYFGLCWVLVAEGKLSPVAANRATLGSCVWASHGFSHCQAQAVGTEAQWAAQEPRAHGPQELARVGSVLVAPRLQHRGAVGVTHRPSFSTACGVFPGQGLSLCPLQGQEEPCPLHHQGSPILLSFYGELFVGKINAYERKWHPTPVLLPGKSHGWRSLEGCSPWGRWGSDTTERLHFHLSLSCIGEGNGTPLQCSCLENPRDGGAWWAAVYGVAQSRTQVKWLSIA